MTPNEIFETLITPDLLDISRRAGDFKYCVLCNTALHQDDVVGPWFQHFKEGSLCHLVHDHCVTTLEHFSECCLNELMAVVQKRLATKERNYKGYCLKMDDPENERERCTFEYCEAFVKWNEAGLMK